MNKFLDTLAGKLAERWLALLVLPGALYVAVAIAAIRLSHVRWYRVDLLRHDLARLASEPAARSPGTIALALAGLLAAAAVAGILNQSLGSLFRGLWFASSRGPLTRALTRRRARRWDTAEQRFREVIVAAGEAQLAGEPGTAGLIRRAEELAAARNAIGLVRPTRPFAAGDRMAAADRRVLDRYALDLTSAWPRLWLALPDTTRSALQVAHGAVAAAQRLAGWAIAYLLLTVVWWPAVLIAVVCLVVAWRRAASAAGTLADLVEAAVDLHGRALARSLGVRSPGPLDRQTGAEITALLRKGT
ncbi:hypothetical protein [Saccharopolyspora cebuensis]|uniref:hypothetical protein n=1 Tax=Saccharopolyspora cebuensis TaxID=418759 RepID=UPI0031EA1F3E